MKNKKIFLALATSFLLIQNVLKHWKQEMEAAYLGRWDRFLTESPCQVPLNWILNMSRQMTNLNPI